MENSLPFLATALASALLLGAMALPMTRIFHRAGFARGWGLLALVPGFGLFACWLLLAAKDWPWRRAA